MGLSSRSNSSNGSCNMKYSWYQTPTSNIKLFAYEVRGKWMIQDVKKTPKVTSNTYRHTRL